MIFVNNTLVCHMSFLATDTQPSVLIYVVTAMHLLSICNGNHNLSLYNEHTAHVLEANKLAYLPASDILITYNHMCVGTYVVQSMGTEQQPVRLCMYT